MHISIVPMYGIEEMMMMNRMELMETLLLKIWLIKYVFLSIHLEEKDQQ